MAEQPEKGLSPEHYKLQQIRSGAACKPGSENYIEYLTRPFTPFGLKKGGVDFGVNKILQFCHLLLMLPLKKGDRVLDIGVGGGWTSEWLARWGLDVTAVDIVPEYIEIVNERAQKAGLDNLKAQIADAENLPFDDEVFDAVIFYDSLHHCPNFRKALSEAHRVLKSGGWFAASEPSSRHRRSCAAYTEQTGIFEGGFSLRTLIKELKKVGFRRCYAVPNPIFFKGHEPHKKLSAFGIKATGLLLDFVIKGASFVLFPWLCASWSFKISAQK